MTENNNEITTEAQETPEAPATETKAVESEVAAPAVENPQSNNVSEPAVASSSNDDDDDDFDWEEAESGYSLEERTRLEAMYAGTLNEGKECEIPKMGLPCQRPTVGPQGSKRGRNRRRYRRFSRGQRSHPEHWLQI